MLIIPAKAKSCQKQNISPEIWDSVLLEFTILNKKCKMYDSGIARDQNKIPF